MATKIDTIIQIIMLRDSSMVGLSVSGALYAWNESKKRWDWLCASPNISA